MSWPQRWSTKRVACSSTSAYARFAETCCLPSRQSASTGLSSGQAVGSHARRMRRADAQGGGERRGGLRGVAGAPVHEEEDVPALVRRAQSVQELAESRPRVARGSHAEPRAGERVERAEHDAPRVAPGDRHLHRRADLAPARPERRELAPDRLVLTEHHGVRRRGARPRHLGRERHLSPPARDHAGRGRSGAASTGSRARGAYGAPSSR